MKINKKQITIILVIIIIILLIKYKMDNPEPRQRPVGTANGTNAVTGCDIECDAPLVAWKIPLSDGGFNCMCAPDNWIPPV